MKLFNLNCIVLSSFLFIIESAAFIGDVTVKFPDSKLIDLCNSPVYCNGPLLHTVQMAGLYKDSKSFVDLYQKYEEHITLDNFSKLMNSTNNNPSTEEIRRFVQENFSEVDELESAILPDWQENPPILNKIQEPKYKEWLKELNNLWVTLSRRIRGDVQQNPNRYSIIYVNNTFIIPGGRFKEYYYWDSYWIIEGLLITGLRDTAKGMIQNFLSLVDNYGFIPNGGRVYYLMRSQPPLLSQMVYKYYEATNDLDFALSALPTLTAEFDYWHEKKTVIVKKGRKTFKLARYVVDSTGPRPESYREDYEAHKLLNGDSRQQHFYSHVKAAAETGWDFSARWFSDEDGEFSSRIWHLAASDVLPVDLNAFVEKNARILAELYALQGDVAKARHYKKISKQYQRAIQNVLWNQADGTWYDFNIRSKKQNTRFYVSNLTPLYTQSYDPNLSAMYGRRSVAYVNRVQAIKVGGMPSSLDNTGQQWDYPNAWAPLMSIAVQGLRNTDYQPAKYLSRRLASLWLQSNYDGFAQNNGAMFEKYNVHSSGCTGGGGEYEPQTGFGWTNGVVLEFLHAYPDAMHNEIVVEPGSSSCPLHSEITGAENPLQPSRTSIVLPDASAPILKSVWDR